jgi:hypothetical protein
MLQIVTFRDHTISALPIPVGNGRWGASYMICNCGKRVRSSSEIPTQSSYELAERAALLLAMQYVEERLPLPQA